jgi:hypothetical protein
MNKADMLIYVHPALDEQTRTDLEMMIEERAGVACAEFNPHIHHHALMVKYDPDSIEGMQILDMVRRTDPSASMVGL